MQTVNVLYKYVDGAHFFVSDDEKTLGLCVADKDIAKAFDAVAPALGKLFKENYGEDAIFIPRMSLEDFERWFVDRNQEAMTSHAPGTAGMLPWARAEAA